MTFVVALRRVRAVYQARQGCYFTGLTAGATLVARAQIPLMLVREIASDSAGSANDQIDGSLRNEVDNISGNGSGDRFQRQQSTNNLKRQQADIQRAEYFE